MYVQQILTHYLHILLHRACCLDLCPPPMLHVLGKNAVRHMAYSTLHLMRSDPKQPRLAGRIFVGGSIRKGGAVKVSTAALQRSWSVYAKALAACWLPMVLSSALHP